MGGGYISGVGGPHVKRGAKRNGGPAYVGAFCFDSSLELDYESMEKAEIKFIYDYLKDLEEWDRK